MKDGSAMNKTLREANRRYECACRMLTSNITTAVPGLVLAVRVLAILLVFGCAGAVHSALAQQRTPSDVRLFIGLTSGDLDRQSESHLRTFIVLRKLVGYVRDQLSQSLNSVRIGDLDTWEDSDWKKVDRLGFTHYLVAQPTRIVPKPLTEAARIDWSIGKVSGGRRTYATSFKETTIISIPVGGEKAAIQQTKTGSAEPSSYNERDNAGDIATKLRLVFPEMRTAHRYFVECFAPLDHSDLEWQDPHLQMMHHLSGSLQFGRWSPVWTMRGPDQARVFCRGSEYMKDPLYHFSEADILVRGELHWGADATGRVLRPIIVIDDRVLTARSDLTNNPVQEDEDMSLGPRSLKGFCIHVPVPFPFEALEGLTEYIQEYGFHSKGVRDLGKWNCYV